MTESVYFEVSDVAASARLEAFGRAGTLAATGLNLALGLLVVALKVLVAH